MAFLQSFAVLLSNPELLGLPLEGHTGMHRPLLSLEW